LASQPTLSTFEDAVTIRALKQLRDVFIDQFIASFATPPEHLTFDLDAVDDPAHGEHPVAAATSKSRLLDLPDRSIGSLESAWRCWHRSSSQLADAKASCCAQSASHQGAEQALLARAG
jgi:hypothetical protein